MHTFFDFATDWEGERARYSIQGRLTRDRARISRRRGPLVGGSCRKVVKTVQFDRPFEAEGMQFDLPFEAERVQFDQPLRGLRGYISAAES